MTSTYLSEELRQRVRDKSNNRCGYCLSPQRYVMGKLEIEHIIPRALGGTDDESNLWLSCSLCNRYKGSQIERFDLVTDKIVSLFNPQTQVWREHFAWNAEGIFIKGLTPIGRATIDALQLNNEIAVEVRRNWILAGWHPPDE
jgi:hypothetical protein